MTPDVRLWSGNCVCLLLRRVNGASIGEDYMLDLLAADQLGGFRGDQGAPSSSKKTGFARSGTNAYRYLSTATYRHDMPKACFRPDTGHKATDRLARTERWAGLSGG